MPKHSFTIKGLKKLQVALSPPAASAEIKKHIKTANKLNGMIAVSEIRAEINKGGYAPNKPLTVAMKGEDKPLIGVSAGGGGGQLFQAITWKAASWSTVFVGVLKTDGFYNIAYFLHEGGQIGVTDKMRAMFFYLWLASIGSITPDKLTGSAEDLWKIMPGGWYPLKKGTSFILVQGRPFIQRAIEQRNFVAQVKKNWEQALAAAMKDIATKAGKS